MTYESWRISYQSSEQAARAAYAECARLQAKVEAMERPGAAIRSIYGAQPAPSVPEGWKLVPIEPTETMIGEGSCASSLPGPHYISEGCAQQCWKYMLAAAPETKP